MRGLIAALLLCGMGWGQSPMARSVMAAWPDGSVLTTKNPGSWGYEEGVLLDGLAADWAVTKNPAELAYIERAVDKYVKADGTIQMNAAGKPFGVEEHQLDNLELGRAILFCYREASAAKDNRAAAKYATAAKFLHEQLKAQPRTASGGYWHKTIYPNQMWLDGAYMAEPFRAEYAATFGEAAEFDDVAKQFELMFTRMRDTKTGLLRHGWDESKTMPWADKETGLSPQVWARAMGWYCMALVDVLDWIPKAHPQRKVLVDEFQQTMAAVVNYWDPMSNVWWQVMDAGPAPITVIPGVEADVNPIGPGNFKEASASAMFDYALAKGVRLGYLPVRDSKIARRAWNGIQKEFVKVTANGIRTLTGTVKAAGLGGTPYRSGTYEYYVGEKTGDNDAKGVGAYLLAGSEMQRVK